MISLIDTLLPSQTTFEGKKFHEQTTLLQSSSQPSAIKAKEACQLDVKIAQLFLTVLEETAEAIVASRYTAFDPLLKNFGCEMSALEINVLVQQKDLFNEAKAILTVIPKLNNEITACDLDLSDQEMRLTDFLNDCIPGLALPLSCEMSKLTRFRLLTKINANQVKEGREIPVTNYRAIADLIGNKEVISQNFIDALQAEEAANAVQFIQGQVEQIESSCLRKEQLTQGVQSVYYKKTKKGTSIPKTALFCNIEVCLRTIKGIVLVQNKLRLGGEPIPNAEKVQIFIAMPEERILNVEEEAALEETTPLYVIEGIVKEKELAAAIERIGLITLVKINASLAGIQFSGCKGARLPDELESERAELETRVREVVHHIFEIDHVFCSSLCEQKEEA